MVYPVDKDHFEIEARVAVSPQFYGWVFGLKNYVTIVSPPTVVEGMKKHLEAVLKRYEKTVSCAKRRTKRPRVRIPPLRPSKTGYPFGYPCFYDYNQGKRWKRRERSRVHWFFLPEELLHALHRNGDAQHKQRNGKAALQQTSSAAGFL